MEEISGPYGKDTACVPIEGADLKEQLEQAIRNIHGEIFVEASPEAVFEDNKEEIPADPDVKNYSYTLVKNQLYYRENSRMYPVDFPKATEERVRGMLAIRPLISSNSTPYSFDPRIDSGITPKKFPIPMDGSKTFPFLNPICSKAL